MDERERQICCDDGMRGGAGNGAMVMKDGGMWRSTAEWKRDYGGDEEDSSEGRNWWLDWGKEGGLSEGDTGVEDD